MMGRGGKKRDGGGESRKAGWQVRSGQATASYRTGLAGEPHPVEQNGVHGHSSNSNNGGLAGN